MDPVPVIVLPRDSLRRRWDRRREITPGIVVCAILRGALVVNEEESEEHEIGDWKSNPGYHVDRLRHSNRMRRFFFP